MTAMVWCRLTAPVLCCLATIRGGVSARPDNVYCGNGEFVGFVGAKDAHDVVIGCAQLQLD